MSDKKSSLSINDIDYIKNNSQLKNSKEILDFYKKFITVYPNRKLSLQDFNSVVKRLIPTNENEKRDNSNVTEQFVKILFDMCDRDESGSIDFKEYMVLFWSRTKGPVDVKLGLIFDIFDLNGSNSIDFHELHSIVKILYKLKYSELDQQAEKNESTNINQENLNTYYIFNNMSASLPPTYYISLNIMKAFDSNRNGTLSKAEFVNGCQAHENIKQFLTPLKCL
jgi:Ca2+-binding EF-hand superfamily protein